MQSQGVPYAKPPLGSLRFAPPVTEPWPTWSGILNATEFKPPCYQLRQQFQDVDRLHLTTTDPPFSEDCLHLNVYTPDGNPPRGGWPVVIWYHPGDFNGGSPNLWDATIFAVKQKVIVVTVSYRLNILGFFTTMDDNAPGNYGLMDQVAAMDWVRAHIGHFNGSNAEVTICGHSAGAVSVSLHLVSGRGQGKFQRAIAMSGNFLVPGSMKKPSVAALDELAEAFYCERSPARLIECLRRVKVEDLLKKGGGIAEWGPVVDAEFANVTDPFLPAHPGRLLADGRLSSKVPLMCGFTDMEEVQTSRLDITEKTFDDAVREALVDQFPPVKDNETCVLNEDLLIDSVLFHYRPELLAQDPAVFRQNYIDLTTDRKYAASTFRFALRVSQFAPTFVYRFGYKAKTAGFSDKREWVNVPQQFELPLVWGMPYWSSLSPQIAWNSADKKTTDVVMTLFANFTKFSDPVQNKKLIRWEPFTAESPRIFIIDKNFNMSDTDTFNYKSVKFWNEYFPKIFDAANMCCNVTEGTVSLRAESVPLLLPVLLLVFLWAPFA